MNILSNQEYCIKEKVICIWEYIQNECNTRNKVDILHELMNSGNTSTAVNSILYNRRPINVLFYEVGHSLSSKEIAENFCIPLTDDNFKLIIKELLINKLLLDEETANFDINAYNSILRQVLNSF